jgi:hypothetical protein
MTDTEKHTSTTDVLSEGEARDEGIERAEKILDAERKGEKLLEVKDLDVTLYSPRMANFPPSRDLSFDHAQGRDACRGWRVGLRQVNDRTLHHGASAPAAC